jgi:hypothetical protein
VIDDLQVAHLHARELRRGAGTMRVDDFLLGEEGLPVLRDENHIVRKKFFEDRRVRSEFRDAEPLFKGGNFIGRRHFFSFRQKRLRSPASGCLP